MRSIRILCLTLALCCLAPCTVLAAEVTSGEVCCFDPQDFSAQQEPLAGICITDLPGDTGVLTLGSRILRSGDILTADQVAQMTFTPVDTQADAVATLSYLPIYDGRVEGPATMTISIRGKSDEAPVAQDSTLETYKNLPQDGKLSVTDPEGQPLTYTLVRSPRRGEVTLHSDGTFQYTPKKNKVGVDSFTYTAADPAGNVSREATVTVQIIKPTDARQYTDTIGSPCRFEAEWLRNTGLFVAETVNGQNNFLPDKTVSRGEFTAMLVDLLDIPTQDTATGLPDDTPDWLRPYLAAAQRAGLTDRLPDAPADSPITGSEAAVMLQNALDLSIPEEALSSLQVSEGKDDTVPTWAETSLTVMANNGLVLAADCALTRADCAEILYQVSKLSLNAPGTSVIRINQ